MEEDLDKLEKLINDYKKAKPHFSEHTEIIISEINYTDIIESIEKLISKNKELKSTLDITKCNYEILQGEMDRIGIDTLHLEAGNSTDDVIDEIQNNYIPKSKIEEKIEELEKTKFGRCTDTIDILQELLEEE